MIGLAKLHNVEIAFRFNPQGNPEDGYYDFRQIKNGTIKQLTCQKATASCWPVMYAGVFEIEFEKLPIYQFKKWKNGTNKTYSKLIPG